MSENMAWNDTCPRICSGRQHTSPERRRGRRSLLLRCERAACRRVCVGQPNLRCVVAGRQVGVCRRLWLHCQQQRITTARCPRPAWLSRPPGLRGCGRERTHRPPRARPRRGGTTAGAAPELKLSRSTWHRRAGTAARRSPGHARCAQSHMLAHRATWWRSSRRWRDQADAGTNGSAGSRLAALASWRRQGVMACAWTRGGCCRPTGGLILSRIAANTRCSSVCPAALCARVRTASGPPARDHWSRGA